MTTRVFAFVIGCVIVIVTAAMQLLSAASGL